MANRTMQIGLLFSSCALLVTSLIAILSIPVRGDYVGDIIGSNTIFWILIVSSLACSLVTMMALSRTDGDSALKALAAISVALCVIVILLHGRFLEVFAVGRGDILSQIGVTNDILRNGEIGEMNFYPMMHLLSASSILILDVEAPTFFSYATLFIWLFFLFSLSAIAKLMTLSGRAFAPALAVSAVLPLGPMHSSFLPMSLAMACLPAILLLAYRASQSTRRSTFAGCFFLFGFCLPMFHPLAALLVIPTIFVFGRTLAKPSDSQASTELKSWRALRTPWLSVFLLVYTIWWIVSFDFWAPNALSLVDYILGEGSSISTGERYFSLLSFSSVGVLRGLLAAFLSVGVVSLLTVALVLSVVLPSMRTMTSVSTRKGIGLGVLCAVAFQIVILVAPTGLDVFRMLWMYGLFAALIVTADFTLLSDLRRNEGLMSDLENRHLRQHPDTMRTLHALLCGLIIIAACITPFSAFKSPAVVQPSETVTDAEIIGAALAFEMSEKASATLMGFGSSKRLICAAVGYQRADDNIFIDVRRDIPDHFGYDALSYANQSFPIDTIVILTSYDRFAYSEVWVSADILHSDDFFRFETTDPSVNRIADEGNLELFIIQG